ncbi:MAG: hypothetical protein AB1643_00700 [Patescibacteria group bacterium]
MYIHLNPLDFLVNKNWRIHKLKDWNSAKKKLLNYPWTSIKAFLVKNHQDLILSDLDILKQQFSNEKEYESFLQSWSIESADKMENFILE